MKQLVQIARALSEPNRIRILKAVCGGELCVCELGDALKLTQSTLSTHLQVIRRAGLVSVRREGRWSYYRLSESGDRFLSAIFGLCGPSLANDGRLTSDGRQLRRLLNQRANGSCNPVPALRRKG